MLNTEALVSGANVSLPELVNLLVQLGIPLLVSLVTKASTKTKWKWALLAALTGANTALLGYSPGQSASSLALTTAMGIVVSLGAHHGIFVPAGLSGALDKVLVKDKEPEAVEAGHESHPEECGKTCDIADVTDHEDEDVEEYVNEGEAETALEAEADTPADEAEVLEPVCTTKHKAGSKAALSCTAVHV